METLKQENKTKKEITNKIIPFSLEGRTEKAILKFIEKNSLNITPKLEEELKKVITNTIENNLKIGWSPLDKLDIVRTPNECLEIMKLRSDVFREDFLGYDSIYPEKIRGICFDEYDSYSSIFMHKNSKNNIDGTIRFCLKNKYKMPSEEFLNIKKFKKNTKFAECSRQAISKKSQGNSITFRSFYANAYQLAHTLRITHYIARIDVPHLKLYEKLGGINIEKRISATKNIVKPSLLISWNLEESSRLFQRGFLYKLK